MKRSFLRSLSRAFLCTDRFGWPVRFKIDGKDTKKTYVGAAFTLICVTMILTFFGFQIKKIIENNYSSNSFTTLKDLTNIPTDISYNDYDFGL